MKNIIALLMLLTVSYGHAQDMEILGSARSANDLNLENVSVTVTVNSAEEIEATFKTKNIAMLLDETGDNEDVSFKIICNGTVAKNGAESRTMSYTVGGNTNDREGFLNRVEKIRTAAINYYKNKK